MNRRLLAAFLLYTLILIVIVLYEYGESFSFYFVGDDFAFIEYVLAEKAAILWKPSCFYHYYPLGLLLIVLPAVFDVFEPAYFAAVNCLFFLACALMIMAIFRKITGNLSGGFLASLIYVTAVPNAEVIYWKTGTSTIAMTFFSLLSLSLFIMHLQRKSRIFFGMSLASFFASILCIEQGIVTFGILVLYDLLFHSIPRLKAAAGERRHILAAFAGRAIILMIVPLSMMIGKRALGAQLSPFPFSQVVWRMPHLAVQTLIRLFDFNRITLGLPLSPVHVSLLVLACMLVSLSYVGFKRSAAGLFFFLVSVGSILTISIAAGGPNERYFSLPLAFFSCFVVLLLKDVAAALASRFRNPAAAGSPVYPALSRMHIIVCLLIALVGLRGMLERRSFWEAASRIERNIVAAVESAYLAMGNGAGQKVYLVNVPAYMVTHKSAIFYIGSNSLLPDLRHRLEGAADRIELAATGNLFHMRLNDEQVTYRALGRQNVVNRQRIRQLNEEGHLVLQFSPRMLTVVPAGKR